MRLFWMPVLLAIGVGPASTAFAQSDSDSDANDPDHKVAAGIVATQLRAQGYRCDDPHKAERDPNDSNPGSQAWVVVCDNAVYRVKLIPDQAAEVSLVE